MGELAHGDLIVDRHPHRVILRTVEQLAFKHPRRAFAMDLLARGIERQLFL